MSLSVNKAIEEQKNRIIGKKLKELFTQNSNRVDQLSIKTKNIYFDYSKNLLDQEVINELLNVVINKNISQKTKDMFTGKPINKTEQRAVLHTALRDLSTNPIYVNNKNIKDQLIKEKHKQEEFATSIYKQTWRTSQDEKIENIVNIGIGGSDLGPKMAYKALNQYKNRKLNHFYVSNVDPGDIEECLINIDPKKTIFFIASKTFNTQETITNAKIAKNWLKDKLGEQVDISKQLVAISTNFQAAQEFGVDKNLIFPFSDWVGGRYSLASAIGLSLMSAIGVDIFNKMLSGMNMIDNHFLTEQPSKNIPIIMAIIGFWYNNVLGAQSHAILPYCTDISLFPDYLQQMDMESNGKMVDQQGNNIDYQTATVIWGGAGTDSQHSFFQLLHQGTKLIPADFIGFCQTNRKNKQSHNILMANFFAQQQALAFGKSSKLVKEELGDHELADFLINFKSFIGNRPSSCLLFDRLTPYSLGQLVALYEHKVFVQGVLWNVFSFDQWGVELGKKLASRILLDMNSPESIDDIDKSTLKQIEHFNSYNN